MSDYGIFKFRAIDKYLLASLVNSEIYFAQLSCLNDPFDCRVDIRRALDNAIIKSPPERRDALRKLRKMQGFLEKVRTKVSEIGVNSFSLELNNPLMWSHYADGHRGISLMYSIPDAYFYDKKDTILGMTPVEYATNPLTDWFVGPDFSLGSKEEFGLPLVKKILTIKAKPWEYEDEVRILRRTPGVESLERKHLKQVYFGLQTTEADRALVTKIIKQGQYDLTPSRKVRCSETDFGIKPEEI